MITLNSKIKENINISSIVVFEIICSILFLAYLLIRPVCNINVPITEGTPTIGRLQEDGYYFDDVHGDLLSSAEEKVFFNLSMNVPAGSYDMRIKYRADNLSFVSLYSPSKDRYVYADNITLTHMPMELPGIFNWDYGVDYLPGFQTSNMYVTRNIDDMDLYIKYSGYGAFYIENIELIGNRNYVIPIFSSYIFMLIILNLFVIWKIKIPHSDSRRILLCLVGMGLFASIPVLFKEGYHYYDYDFLYSRIEGIAKGLLDGQFPVRIHPQTLRNYGYAVSEFYPELFLYPLGIMRIMGFSLNFCVGTIIVVINVLTALVAYYSIYIVCENKIGSFVGAFMYLLSCYRLYDIYQRGALGEYIAIAFLPLFVAGIYVVLKKQGSILPITIAMLGILNSHLLSCEMVAIFTIFSVVICLKQYLKKQNVLAFTKSIVFSVLLSMYFIIPFIYMSKSDRFRVYESNAYNPSDFMLSIKEVLVLPYSVSVPLIMLIMISMVLLYYSLIEKRTTDSENGKLFKSFRLFAGFGLLSLYFTSKYFPWPQIERIEGVFKDIFCMVQFPCRYLAIVSVFFSFAIAMGIKCIVSYGISKKAFILVCSVFSIALVIQTGVYFTQIHGGLEDSYAFYDYGGIVQIHGVSSGEYMPVTFDEHNLDNSVEKHQLIMNNGEDSGLILESVDRSGTKMTVVVANNTGSDQILYLPVTYYIGYKVSNAIESNDGFIPTLFETDKGTIGVVIPNGYYNGVHLEYKSPVAFRIGEIISLLMFVFVLGLSIKNRKLRIE